MKIYLDVCCLNRPFDDQTQDRVHLEAEAVLSIFKYAERGELLWLSSDVVKYEISNTPNTERRERLFSLESRSSQCLQLTETIMQHAESFQRLGFTTYDALHLAFAASENVDVFLSTDDKLIKRAQRYPDEVRVTVANPLTWLHEVFL